MKEQKKPLHNQSECARLTEAELDNLGVVLSAYRSFRGDRRQHIAYVTMPITSGRRLCNALKKHGAKSAAELAAKIGDETLWQSVIKPNIDEGIALADRLGSSKSLLFVAPSVFSAKCWQWSQDAYMSLWYRVLGEMAGAHYLADGWEYCVGGVKEAMFSMAMQWRIFRRYNIREMARVWGLQNFHPGMSAREEMAELERMWMIRLYDERGQELRIDQILAMVVKAIKELAGDGLPYDDLLGPAWNLKKMPILSPLIGGGNWGDEPFVPEVTSTYVKAADELEAFETHP